MAAGRLPRGLGRSRGCFRTVNFARNSKKAKRSDRPLSSIFWWCRIQCNAVRITGGNLVCGRLSRQSRCTGFFRSVVEFGRKTSASCHLAEQSASTCADVGSTITWRAWRGLKNMAVIGSSTAGGDGRRRREGGSGHWTGCCSMWALYVEERKKKKEEKRWVYILRFSLTRCPARQKSWPLLTA